MKKPHVKKKLGGASLPEGGERKIKVKKYSHRPPWVVPLRHP